jgi:fermentation-respiration switch protein FrsA (DUF1100 family)
VVIVEKEQIKNVSLLHVVKVEDRHAQLPFIIFEHGVTSAKEHNLHYAYLLAEKGFRVILPEALYHGDREEDLSQKELFSHFWKIVLTTIHEMDFLKEYYVQENLVDLDRIGVVGTSMGGIAVLGALTQYPWIKSAVSLMGMPAYEQFSLWQLEQLQNQGFKLPLSEEQITEQLSVLKDFDLSLHPEKLNKRPLLFWHAKNDPVVPYQFTYDFFESIKREYNQTPEKIKFISDDHAGHKVSREGIKATVNWFEKYLLH